MIPTALYVPTLGGTSSLHPALAYDIPTKGWGPFVDEHVRPTLGGPNPPTELVLHAPGPCFAETRGGVVREVEGRAWPVYEFDWPLTYRELMPRIVEDFAEVWGGVADGSRYGNAPLRMEVYTGRVTTPQLELIRRANPGVYVARLQATCRFFYDAGFHAVWVDALSYGPAVPADHPGLATLANIHRGAKPYVGTEAYPVAIHDEVAGDMPWFAVYSVAKRQAPVLGGNLPGATAKPRPGRVLLHRGEFTPERLQEVLDAGCFPCVENVNWRHVPPQRPSLWGAP